MGDVVRVFTKGAPDMVLELCANAEGPEGVVGIDDECAVPIQLIQGEETEGDALPFRELYERTVKHFAKQAYRTLLICYKDITVEDFEALKADNNDFETDADRECLETDLTAIGIFGLQDPLRETIVGSI